MNVSVARPTRPSRVRWTRLARQAPKYRPHQVYTCHIGAVRARDLLVVYRLYTSQRGAGEVRNSRADASQVDWSVE